MLGSGKSGGVVNEASNLKANQNLTATIESMATREYMQSRDMSDVIPTHRRDVAGKNTSSLLQNSHNENGVAVYDPAMEKLEDKISRGVVIAELVDENEGDEDDELMELRRQRMTAIKQKVEEQASWRSKQHGSYREIGQDDFFNTVVREKGGSERCCVHFYHKDFETCKVIDRRLSELAQEMLPVKFVKIDAERAPFLVERLHVNTLPCCLLFKNDICVDRILGYEGCADESGMLNADLLREHIEHTLSLNA